MSTTMKHTVSFSDLVALAAKQAAQADADRRVQPDVIEAVVAAGLPGWFVAERWGGRDGTCSELTRVLVEIGQECSSTAWLASVLAYSARYATYLPQAGQAELWGENPNALVISAIKPQGNVVPTDGGWRLSGAWAYASGVEFSDWVLVTSPVPGTSDEPIRFFALPRQDYTFVDTWSAIGMRATGTHTVVIDDAFVPAHRAFLWDDARDGRSNTTLRNPVSALAVNGLTFVPPALGAAQNALNSLRAAITEQPTGGTRAVAAQSSQVEFARAAGHLDAAELLLRRVATTADDGPLDVDLVRRSRRDSALALEMLTGVVDALIRIGGTRGLEDTHPLQRSWRDVHLVASHAAMQFEPAALYYLQGVSTTV